METIQIHIDMKDEDYQEALARGLMRCDHRFQITTGQGEDAPERDYDLYLRDRPKQAEQGEEHRWKKTAYLSEDAFREDREKHCYYQYGNIRQLAGELILIHAQNLGRPMILPTGCHVPLIGILAARGGLGCTTLTRKIAGELSQYDGKRILFLSMEAFSREVTAGGPRHDGIREFMYYYHRGQGKAAGVAEPFLYQSETGFFAFHSFGGRNPLIEEDVEGMIGFLDHLKQAGFDGILMDLGTGVYPSSLAAMAVCDRLFLLTPEEAGDEDLTGEENYRRWLMGKLPEGEDVSLRMVRRNEEKELAQELATLLL